MAKLETQERMQADPDDPRHGTMNGYRNLRCRCGRCREANKLSFREARQRRVGSLADDDPRHGKATTYSNWGCRCDACRAAATTEAQGRGQRPLRNAAQRGCSIEGCDAPHLARGWCYDHYRRWSMHGDPLSTGEVRLRGPETEGERFWSKVDKTGDCWIWNGGVGAGGYGAFGSYDEADDPITVRAHRYAYEALVGPIPAGLVLDHLCRVRRCVNPAHLEPVTNAENIRRGFDARGYARVGAAS